LETLSEELFVLLCAQIDIACDRVPTASDISEYRPDFVLTGRRGTLIFAEIKQFDPSPEEQIQIRRILADETGELCGTPGGRIREVIDRANRQLKALSNGMHPGLLVVYNNVPGASYHTEDYAVLTAMRGLDVVPVVVPSNPREPVTFLDARPGPKRKLRPDANTHVSAIAVLARGRTAELRLAVYHNPHAKAPLPPAELIAPCVMHHRMREDQSGWEDISSET
jgi:hypothetical protein